MLASGIYSIFFVGVLGNGLVQQQIGPAAQSGRKARPAEDPWHGAREVEMESSLDGAVQRVMFYVPNGERREGGAQAVPLLVALHTWSGDYRQPSGAEYLQQCKGRQWVLIHPDFRGPNRRPEACASRPAMQDVLDAVAYARQHANVDRRRIYLVGASGGGHMALMMACRAPQLWAGVSAWVPITDLAAWYRECKNAAPPRDYWRDLELVCGGPPDAPLRKREYRRRSPDMFRLHAAKGLPVDLNAGIHDGHTGSVPVHHTLDAFNALASANGQGDRQIGGRDARFIATQRRLPDHLAFDEEPAAGRKHPVLFQRQAGPVRVTLFDGGHEIDVPAAVEWLAAQRTGG